VRLERRIHVELLWSRWLNSGLDVDILSSLSEKSERAAHSNQ